MAAMKITGMVPNGFAAAAGFADAASSATVRSTFDSARVTIRSTTLEITKGRRASTSRSTTPR